MMLRKFPAIAMLVLLTSCAHSQYTSLNTQKITDPKVIALDAPREPWVIEIEKRLKANGFRVLRSPGRTIVKDKTETQERVYKEAEARYVLAIDASAYLDDMHRCFGGGYRFVYITTELVDLKSNETLFNMSDSGYSEGCPPMSGKIFSNIADAVNKAWQ